MLIVTGDWKAKVGNKAESNVIGKFGLGVSNAAGDQLMDSCEANNLFTTNTCFKQLTDDYIHGHHQMAYREIKQTMQLEAGDGEVVFSAQTRPGADWGTDHKLFIQNISES